MLTRDELAQIRRRVEAEVQIEQALRAEEQTAERQKRGAANRAERRATARRSNTLAGLMLRS